MHVNLDHLMAKLKTLPPERLLEVEDFVDFLRLREQDERLVQAAEKLSEAKFKSVWDNPEDAVYDQL